MGRIYEALRRSTGNGEIAPAGPSVTADGDLFLSPWTFSKEFEAPSNPAPVSTPLDVLEDDEPGGYNPGWTSQLAVSVNSHTLLAEQFRFLGASLHREQAARTLKRIMVTSAAPGDGKTLTALNLSLILSESYRRRVLLIDADLRRPSIHEITRVGKTEGLSDRLKTDTDQKLPVVRLTKTLTLLPAGRPDPDPMSALTSPRMKGILEEAAVRFDWVILDTPPVGTVADAGLLAAMTDAVLFVVRAGYTRYPVVKKGIEAVGQDRLFGIVLNGVERAQLKSYESPSSRNRYSRSND